jgi:hypothetical protein
VDVVAIDRREKPVTWLRVAGGGKRVVDSEIRVNVAAEAADFVDGALGEELKVCWIAGSHSGMQIR